VELDGTLLNSIERSPTTLEPKFRGNVEDNSKIGLHFAKKRSAQAEKAIHAQASSVSLISNCRQVESLAYNHIPPLYGGTNHLFYELGATGEIKEEFRPRGEPLLVRVEQNPPNPFANRRTARFAGQDYTPAEAVNLLGEDFRLSSFPGPVRPVQNDELSFLSSDLSTSRESAL